MDHIGAFPADEWQFYSVIPEDEGYLGSVVFPREESAPFGAASMLRHLLQGRLIEFAAKLGIPTHWSHELNTIEQDDEQVSVLFSNGTKESFSFVIGCDGLHSNTRKEVIGEQPATYTGLSMVRYSAINVF